MIPSPKSSPFQRPSWMKVRHMIEGEDGDVYCEAANLKGDSVDFEV